MGATGPLRAFPFHCRILVNLLRDEPLARRGDDMGPIMARVLRRARVELCDLDVLLFVAHYPRGARCSIGHYALVGAHLRPPSLHYWDTAPGYVSTTDRDAMLSAVAFGLGTAESIRRTAEWPRNIHVGAEVPRQTNGVDCSVLVLAMMRCIMRGTTWDFTGDDGPIRLRQRLAVDALRHGVGPFKDRAERLLAAGGAPPAGTPKRGMLLRS